MSEKYSIFFRHDTNGINVTRNTDNKTLVVRDGDIDEFHNMWKKVQGGTRYLGKILLSLGYKEEDWKR